MSVLTTRNELLTASGLDWLHIVDVSDPTDSPQGTSKKIKLDNIFANYLGFDTRYYTKTEINNFLGGFTSISGYNKNDWDDAFGWGDHSTAGYLESLQDGQGTIVDNSDPVNPKVNWGGFMDEGMELEIDAADDNEIGIYWYLYDNPGAEVEFGFHPTNINLSWNAEGSDHDLIIGGNRTILRAYVPDTDLGHYRDDLIEIGGQASGEGVLLESQDHDTDEKSSFKIRPFGMFMETPSVHAGTATNGQVLTLVDAVTGQFEFQNESIASAGQGLTNDSGVLNLGGTIDEEVIIDMKAQGLGASFSIQDIDQESNQIYFDHNEISIRNDTAVHINAHEINEGLVDIRAGVVNIKTGAKTSNGLLKLMTPDVFDNDAVAGQVLTLIDEETGEVDFRDTAATFDGTFDGNISFERPTTPTVGGYDVTMDESSLFLRSTSADNVNSSHIQVTPTGINLNGSTTIYNPLTVYAATQIYGGYTQYGNSQINGSITVSNDAEINGSLNVADDSEITGNLDVLSDILTVFSQDFSVDTTGFTTGFAEKDWARVTDEGNGDLFSYATQECDDNEIAVATIDISGYSAGDTIDFDYKFTGSADTVELIIYTGTGGPPENFLLSLNNTTVAWTSLSTYTLTEADISAGTIYFVFGNYTGGSGAGYGAWIDNFVVNTIEGGNITSNGIIANGITANSFSVGNLNSAPTSSTAIGTTGEIRFTSDHIYVCVATDTWKRAELSTW